MSEIVFAFPSKGRIREFALEHFGNDFFSLNDKRSLQIDINGVDNVLGLLLPAAEIAYQLRHGDVHVGLTGEDLVNETSGQWKNYVASLARLPFAKAKLAIGVPQSWVDVNSMEDLDDAAINFRKKHGRRMRFATKYPRIMREFFSNSGVIDYRIIESLGATEAAPANNMAEAICDLISTGKTLNLNGLKTLSDGTIFESQAALFFSHQAKWDKAKLQTAKALLKKMKIDEKTLKTLKA